MQSRVPLGPGKSHVVVLVLSGMRKIESAEDQKTSGFFGEMVLEFSAKFVFIKKGRNNNNEKVE